MLCDVGVVVFVGFRDRLIVCNGAVAVQYLIHHVLAIDGQFHRLAHARICKQRIGCDHAEGVVDLALCLDQVNARHSRQQASGGWIDRVHRVNFTSLQRGCPGVYITNCQHLNRVEMSAVSLPIVRVLTDD